MRFEGKVAIITGGAGGIGKATAELIAREGGKVLIADMAQEGVDVAAEMKANGLEVEFLNVDISQEDQVEKMVRTAVARWARLDVMVANAGIGGLGAADTTSLADWNRVIGVNLTGVYLCIKHAVPALRASGGGAIVNTASIMGLVGTLGALPYTAAKGAVVNMTRSAALDHAIDGIRINAVCPGHLEKPTARAEVGAPRNDELLARYPLGRLGRPEDVAHAIAFLASDAAAFITGSALVVDGGYTAR